MIGLSEEKIKLRVPEHLRDEALRMFNLGYEVNFRTIRPNLKKSRLSRREVIDAQNDGFTQLRLTIVWASTRGPLPFFEGSVRDDEGEQLKLTSFENANDFWTFAESNGRCPCGERAQSERSARAIVLRARRAKTGNNVDMYRCSRWAEYFHVTDNPHPKMMRG